MAWEDKALLLDAWRPDGWERGDVLQHINKLVVTIVITRIGDLYWTFTFDSIGDGLHRSTNYELSLCTLIDRCEVRHGQR